MLRFNRMRLVLFFWFLCFALSILTAHAEDSNWAVGFGPFMNTARMGHWSAVIPDGRLVVFGGHGDGFTSLDSAEIWNPAFDNFSLITMQYSHDFGAFTRLQDGRYLIAGGAADLGVAPGYATAEIYDPEDNSFTSAGVMSRARMNASAATLSNGRILVVGGWYDLPSATYGERFNPSTKSFESTGALITSRALPLVLPTNDAKAVVFGGVGYFGSPMIESVELYDFGSNSFTLLQDTLFDSAPGWYVSATNYALPQQLPDGRYLLLAYRPNGSVNDYTLFTFDPSTKVFARQLTSPPLPDSGVVNLWPPIVDEASQKVYLYGTGNDEVDVWLDLYVVDWTDWTLSTPPVVKVLPDGFYLGGVSAALLQEGLVSITGGHSQTGYETNFSPVNYTILSSIETADNCVYSISPLQQNFGASGGTGSVTVTASSSSCAWTATGNDEWLTITSSSSGSGNGAISYSVDENSHVDTKTGTLTIAGKTFTVVLAGSPDVETDPSVLETQAKVLQIYSGVWEQVPDSQGLNYWVSEISSGHFTYVDVATSFFDQPLVQEKYAGAQGDALLEALYLNLFKIETPDAEGFAYWQNKITVDPTLLEENIGTLIMQMIDGMWANPAAAETQALYANFTLAGQAFCDAQVVESILFSELSETEQLSFLSAARFLTAGLSADTTALEIAALVEAAMQSFMNGEVIDFEYIDWTKDATNVTATVVLPGNSPLAMADVEVSVVYNSYKPDQDGEVTLKVPDSLLTDAFVLLPVPNSDEYVVYLFASILPGETTIEFSAAATAVNLILNGIERTYLTGNLSSAEIRSIIRSNSASFITSFSAALALDPYILRSENLANVYNSAFYAALSASQSALQQAQQAQAASQMMLAASSETDSEGLTVEPAKEIQDFKILPARGGLTGYGNMTGDILIQNDSMLPARYKTVNLFTGLTTHTPPISVFGDIVNAQASLVYGYNAGSSTTANNHFESIALTLYTAGWKLYFNDDAALQSEVRSMNRVLNQRLLLDNIVNILSNLVPVSDEAFYKAWLQWLGDQSFFQTAMDKLYEEKDLKGAVEGFVTGMLNWDNLRDTLKFVAKYYAKKAATDPDMVKSLLKEKAKWLFKITTLKAKIWIYAADLASTEVDLISTDPVIEFTKVSFPLNLENYGPSGLSKVRNLSDNRRMTFFGDGLNAFSSGGTNYEPTIVLEAKNTADEKRTFYVAATDIHSGGSDSIWFDLPYDWANTGSDIKGPIYFQLRHAFVDPYTGNVVSNVSFPHELSDNAFYKIDLTSDLLITGVSKDKVTRGEDLTIFGSGFAPLMSQNHVTFTDCDGRVVEAEVTYGTDSYLEVSVPEDLEIGPLWINIELEDGTESNEYKISLIPKPVEVSPADGADFETQLVVTLTQSEDIDIFYTIDNGTEQSYSGPITINKTSTIYPYARKTVDSVDYTSMSSSFFYYKCAGNEVLENGECVDPNATEPVTFNFLQSWEKVHWPTGDREAATINFTANVNGQVENALNPSVTLKNFNVDNAKLVEVSNMKFVEDIIVSGTINMSLSAFTITAIGYDYNDGSIREENVYTYSNPQLVRYVNDVWVETYPDMNFRWEAFSDTYYNDTDLYVEYTVAVDGWYRSSGGQVTYTDEIYQNQKMFHLKIDAIKDVPSWGTP